MVFCNMLFVKEPPLHMSSHNPYFNRWFSAIVSNAIHRYRHGSHNPYFNRWFSAIDEIVDQIKRHILGHNPYFNRWFSAI